MHAQQVIRHGKAVGRNDARNHEQQAPQEDEQAAHEIHAQALPVHALGKEHSRPGRFAVQGAVEHTGHAHIHIAAHEEAPSRQRRAQRSQANQHTAQLGADCFIEY